MTAHAWDWRHRRGSGRTLLPGVSVSHVGAPTADELAWAAVLHCGRGPALTGDWALVRQGMRLADRPRQAHVAVPQGRVVRRGALLHVDPPVPVLAHQVRRLSELVHPARTPAVVRVAPAVLHAVAHAPSDRAAEWRVAAVVQQRLTDVGELRAALRAPPRVRRRALLQVGQWDADVLRANAVVVAQRHDRVLLLRFTTGNLRHDELTVVRQLRAVLLP